jgi:1,2-diacylglycerol 3-alpha-glucosyltransferase
MSRKSEMFSGFMIAGQNNLTFHLLQLRIELDNGKFQEAVMRIGMMTDMYKPYISGVITYISLNKKYLEKQGHEVFVFTFGNGRFPEDEPNVIRSPGLPIKRGEIYMNGFYTPSSNKLLRSMDILHVNHPFFSGFVAISSNQAESQPIVFTNHTRYDTYSRIYLKGFFYVIGINFLKNYFSHFYQRMDAVIIPSKSMEEVIWQFQPLLALYTVPHGMELDPFYRTGIARDRAEFGFHPDDILFIYVGRLWPEKNLPFLLESFAQICQKHDNIRLLVVGDGPDRRKLIHQVTEAGIDTKVHFTGAIDHSQLPQYYQAADIFITPSITETFGLTVIEAMASGLPVIGIESVGISDTVVHGVTGLLSTNDSEEFTEAMSRLVVNRDLRQEMGKNALRESSKYRIENSVERLLEVYQQAIRNRKEKHIEGKSKIPA